MPQPEQWTDAPKKERISIVQTEVGATAPVMERVVSAIRPLTEADFDPQLRRQLQEQQQQQLQQQLQSAAHPAVSS